MSRISSLWSEFKAFAFKGNMIDLAVAVVIGAAFSGIINSLVADIIMPGISYVVTAAKETKDVVATTAEKAAAVAGVTTAPSTEPASQPATAPATEPATMPVVAMAAATGSAPPDLLIKLGALQAQVDQMKADAEAAAKAAAAKAAEPKAVEFTWTIGRFKIGDFIGEIINFLLIAAAVFFVIVKLLGSVMKKAGGTPKPSEPTTKECPFCLSVIPLKAKKCPNCTADLPVPA